MEVPKNGTGFVVEHSALGEDAYWSAAYYNKGQCVFVKMGSTREVALARARETVKAMNEAPEPEWVEYTP